MRITLRIYKRHDPDLFAFYFASGKEYDIKENIKNSLKCYLTNNQTKQQIPDLICPALDDLPPKINFHIQLKKEEDKEIIEWLNTIKKGRRNNLIKNIFRNSFDPIIAPYYEGSENGNFKINERRETNNG